MTIGIMQAFGVEVQRVDEATFRVEPQSYQSVDLAIEPDASAASYFWAAAADHGGRCHRGGTVAIGPPGRCCLPGLSGANGLRRRGNARMDLRVIGRGLRGIDVDMR